MALTDGRLWNGPLLSGQQPTSTRLPGAVASVENDPSRSWPFKNGAAQTGNCVAYRGSQIPVLMGLREAVPNLGLGKATTPFHRRNCWISSRMAARGARADARADAAHRRAHVVGRKRS